VPSSVGKKGGGGARKSRRGHGRHKDRRGKRSDSLRRRGKEKSFTLSTEKSSGRSQREREVGGEKVNGAS